MENKQLSRRKFLTNSSILGISAPLIATKAVVDLARQRKEPIPTKQAGDILTSDFINELVNRINELESRI